MASKFSGLTTAGAPARMMVIHPLTGENLIRSDTGEETWIECYPAQSERGAAIDRELRTKMNRSGLGMTPKALDQAMVIRLSKLTTAWSLALLDGTPVDLPYTEEDAAELYGLPNAGWLRDQLSVFVQNLGNFQQTPSPTS